MSDSTTEGAGGVFDDPVRLRGDGARLRPSLGEIGLHQFAPYLINRISLNWGGESLSYPYQTWPHAAGLRIPAFAGI